MPAPPTSPRTGRAQGGPGAGPAPALGAEDTSEDFRPLGPDCMLNPATYPAHLERPCCLGVQPSPAE